MANTTFKLLYGQAFRAPNAYELFWSQSGVAKSNPLLRPETNETSEVVLEQSLGEHLRLTTTAFHYTVDDLITQETDPQDELLVYNNVDQVKAKGLELEGEAKWPTGLQTRLSYTVQDSQDQQTGLPLTNSPRHLVQFNAQAPLLQDRVVAGFEFQYMSRRKTIAGTYVPAVFVPNFTLASQKLPHGLELSASIYNVDNHIYADPGSEEHRQDIILQDGRSFRVKLIYRFGDRIEHVGAKVNTVRRAGRMLRTVAAMLGCVVAMTASPVASTQRRSEAPPEYMIKAAYLYNFAMFVEWPRDAFATPDAPVTIGIVGDDPFGPALELTMEGKRISKRPIVVRRLQSDQDLRGCHILFMGASESVRIGELASRVAGLPILIVGDASRLATRGATIKFIVEDNRVRFEVNVEAARRARLIVSSKMLRVAKIVKEQS